MLTDFKDTVRKIQILTKNIVEFIVNGRFDELDILTDAQICPSEELMESVYVDEVELCMPPEEAFEDVSYDFLNSTKEPWAAKVMPFPEGWADHNLSIIEVVDGSWHVDFNVWIKPMNRSDYVLSFSLAPSENGKLKPSLETLFCR